MTETSAADHRARRRQGNRWFVLWILGGVVMLGLAGWITHSDTEGQVDSESTARQHDTCSAQKIGRDALRLVINLSFEQRAPIELPSDPTVDPAVIRYLQRVVNESASSPETTALRDAILAAVPPYRCVGGVTLRAVTPPRPLPTGNTIPSR